MLCVVVFAHKSLNPLSSRFGTCETVQAIRCSACLPIPELAYENLGETCITSGVQVQVPKVDDHPRLSQCKSRHSMHAHVRTD